MEKLKTVHAAKGETLAVINNWTAKCEKRGVTIDSSSWDYNGAGTVSGAALSGLVASCLLTPEGYGCLENTVILSNGEVLKAYRKVEL